MNNEVYDLLMPLALEDRLNFSTMLDLIQLSTLKNHPDEPRATGAYSFGQNVADGLPLYDAIAEKLTDKTEKHRIHVAQVDKSIRMIGTDLHGNVVTFYAELSLKWSTDADVDRIYRISGCIIADQASVDQFEAEVIDILPPDDGD